MSFARLMTFETFQTTVPDIIKLVFFKIAVSNEDVYVDFVFINQLRNINPFRVSLLH